MATYIILHHRIALIPLNEAHIVRDELPELTWGIEYALDTRVSYNSKSLFCN